MKLHSYCQPEATREAKLIPAVHPRLEDIVQPLLDFLNTKERDPEHGPYAVVAPSPFSLSSGHPGVHVELHANTKQCALHATFLATLLNRSATGASFTDDAEDHDPHPTCGPLRFCVTKKTFGCPYTGTLPSFTHLLIDYLGELDVVAARKQIAALVEVLSDDNNRISMSMNDLTMF